MRLVAMVSDQERRMILEMIESGRITPEEGLSLLQALGEAQDQDDEGLPEGKLPEGDAVPGQVPEAPEAPAPPPVSPSVAVADPEVIAAVAPAPGIKPDFERFRRISMIPLWSGVIVTVLGGVLMYQVLQSRGLGFWFVCASTPFVLGLGVVVLAWQARTARWLHLRIKQKEGERPRNINLSVPLPLRFIAWLLRVARGRIAGLDNTSVDEVIIALGNSTNPDEPLYIHVDETDDGEEVQIYIG
jgi:hypothetical protein